MKTIKQLDAFRPEKQLKQFFSQICLGQIVFSVLVLGFSFTWTLFSYLNLRYSPTNKETNNTKVYDFWSIFAILSVSDVF